MLAGITARTRRRSLQARPPGPSTNAANARAAIQPSQPRPHLPSSGDRLQSQPSASLSICCSTPNFSPRLPGCRLRSTANPAEPSKHSADLIEGRNVEIIPNQRIVQAWRPSHWDPGVYSIVRFELKPQGSRPSSFSTTPAFPKGKYDSLNAGVALALLGAAEEIPRRLGKVISECRAPEQWQSDPAPVPAAARRGHRRSG